jgi:prepilin peptidase CpaA
MPVSLFQSVMTLLITAPLVGLLSTAAWYDVRSYRIPNLLTVPGAALGIALNALLPSGLGLTAGLAGFALALFGLLPLYLLRVWGAGDVKLMAVVGAFLGPVGLLWSLLAAMIAGGLVALAYAAWRRSGRLLFANLRAMGWQLLFNIHLRKAEAFHAPAQSAGKVAYALPILLGTSVYLAYRSFVEVG